MYRYMEMTKSYFRWFAIKTDDVHIHWQWNIHIHWQWNIWHFETSAIFLAYNSSTSNQNARLLLNLNLATQSYTTRITLLPLTLSLSSLMATQSTLPAWPRHAWTHSTEFSSLCHSQINMVWSCDPEMNLQVGPPS